MIPWKKFDRRRKDNIPSGRFALWACANGTSYTYITGAWGQGATFNLVVRQPSGSITVLNDGSFYAELTPPVDNPQIDNAIPVDATPGVSDAWKQTNQLNP